MEEEAKRSRDEVTSCLAQRREVKEYLHERKESLFATQQNIKNSLKMDEKSITKMEHMVTEAQRT